MYYLAIKTSKISGVIKSSENIKFLRTPNVRKWAYLEKVEVLTGNPLSLFPISYTHDMAKNQRLYLWYQDTENDAEYCLDKLKLKFEYFDSDESALVWYKLL